MLRVDQLMHRGDELPVVSASTPMRDAIYEMSRKRFGITAVVDDEGRLAGVISDGDFKRILVANPDPWNLTAAGAIRFSAHASAASTATATASVKGADKAKQNGAGTTTALYYPNVDQFKIGERLALATSLIYLLPKFQSH